jgi:hypothetical protein
MLAIFRRLPAVLAGRTPLAKTLGTGAAGAKGAKGEVVAYSGGVQLMHWVMGGAIGGAVATVLLAQDTPKEDKEKKTRYMFLHKSWYVHLPAIALLILIVTLLFSLISMSASVQWLVGRGFAVP